MQTSAAMAAAAKPVEAVSATTAKAPVFVEQEMHAWGIHPAAVTLIMANPAPYEAIIQNAKNKGQADIEIGRQLKLDTGSPRMEEEAVIDEAAIWVANYAMSPKRMLGPTLVAENSKA